MIVPGQERSCMEPGYRVYPRVDCDERFAVVAPNGCALSLRPLWENEAEFVAKTLNALAQRECGSTKKGRPRVLPTRSTFQSNLKDSL